MNPEDYVTPEAKHAAQLDEMSVPQGAPPVPLYGVPGMGQEAEVSVPFYRKPWFCYGAGGAAGFGAAWLFLEWFRPKYMKKNVRRRKKSED